MELFNEYLSCVCKERSNKKLDKKENYIYNIENQNCHMMNNKYNNIYLNDRKNYYKKKYYEKFGEKYNDNMTDCERFNFFQNYDKNNKNI